MSALSFIGMSFQTIGSLMLTFVLMSLHKKFKEERAIDETVIDEMDREQTMTVLALIFISLGWVIQIINEFRGIYHNKVHNHMKHLLASKQVTPSFK